tara:strand:- start:2168 stop:2359 length:192 start_codon:yes stop_codon:yes gene_type:complete
MKDFFWKFMWFAAMLPFRILYNGFSMAGQSIGVMSADQRIEQEKDRGIVNVNSNQNVRKLKII